MKLKHFNIRPHLHTPNVFTESKLALNVPHYGSCIAKMLNTPFSERADLFLFYFFIIIMHYHFYCNLKQVMYDASPCKQILKMEVIANMMMF